MEITIFIVGIIILVIGAVLGVISLKNFIKKRELTYNDLTTIQKKNLDKFTNAANSANLRRQEAEKELAKVQQETQFELQARSQKIEQTIKLLEEQKEMAVKAAADAIANQKKIVDTNVKAYCDLMINKYQRDVDKTKEEILRDAQAEFEEEVTARQQRIEQLTQELKEAQAKRDAINQQISRQREIEEQRDFYRICLTDEDLADITVLNRIKSNLSKPTFLDKAIYDNYVSKYVKEMSKRVLKGENPTGIYKVTNIQTQEVYIGKSTTIADRWTNHCKSAYGLEGVSDSRFQRALKKYGIQNFTWELLEKTTKEQLTNREKYYIEFYNTTKFGYNQRLG